jgi:hypothetical protein
MPKSCEVGIVATASSRTEAMQSVEEHHRERGAPVFTDVGWATVTNSSDLLDVVVRRLRDAMNL